jgi:oxygen-independent coproporphyrinogen-3 oxidase
MLMADAIIFGLRMNAGIDLEAIARRFPKAAVFATVVPLLERFTAEGLMVREGTHVRLTHPGRLVCDAIGTAVLEALA